MSNSRPGRRSTILGHSGELKMKTVTELENELRDWKKCIQFETEEKALSWYLIAYVETWLELREAEYALFWQLN